jgi:D-alanyl-D-alanine carboxypeptidase
MRGARVIGAALVLAFLFPAPGAPAGDGSGEPEFWGRVWKIPPNLKQRMHGSSWHAGCPVPIKNLRLLTLTHWGYDGEVHHGRLVVRRAQAEPVLWVMKRLFKREFPIKRMRVVDAYNGNDNASMKANNTSAFNCRYVAGTTTWSQHAFGTAIDINPVQNPYVSSGGDVSPPKGKHWVDRTKDHPGMIKPGGVVVRAFGQIGWEWGGFWSSSKDYQHLSLTGK